jgi:glycine dehydrogenase
MKMLAKDLLKATQFAILNANYIMTRLKDHYPILYKGSKGYCAHEFIIDIRKIKVL